MKYMNFSVAVTLIAMTFSSQSWAVTWVNKNVAQSNDPSKAGYVTMLVDHEFSDKSRNAYLCRENDRSDGLTNVGKAIVEKGKPLSQSACYIPWKGKEYKRTENFDLLQVGGKWVAPSSTTSHYFNSGYSYDIHLDSYSFGDIIGQPIYACMDLRTGTLGKLMYVLISQQGYVGTCYVPMGGREHAVPYPGYAKRVN